MFLKLLQASFSVLHNFHYIYKIKQISISWSHSSGSPKKSCGLLLDLKENVFLSLLSMSIINFISAGYKAYDLNKFFRRCFDSLSSHHFPFHEQTYALDLIRHKLSLWCQPATWYCFWVFYTYAAHSIYSPVSLLPIFLQSFGCLGKILLLFLYLKTFPTSAILFKLLSHFTILSVISNALYIPFSI